MIVVVVLFVWSWSLAVWLCVVSAKFNKSNNKNSFNDSNTNSNNTSRTHSIRLYAWQLVCMHVDIEESARVMMYEDDYVCLGSIAFFFIINVVVVGVGSVLDKKNLYPCIWTRKRRRGTYSNCFVLLMQYCFFPNVFIYFLYLCFDFVDKFINTYIVNIINNCLPKSAFNCNFILWNLSCNCIIWENFIRLLLNICNKVSF